MKIFERFFPDAYKLAELGKINDDLREQYGKLVCEHDNVKSRLLQTNQEITGLRARAEAAEKHVREQTEADLLLVSLKILIAAAQGKTKNELVDLERQQLILQSAGMQYPTDSLVGLLSGLGLQGLVK